MVWACSLTAKQIIGGSDRTSGFVKKKCYFDQEDCYMAMFKLGGKNIMVQYIGETTSKHKNKSMFSKHYLKLPYSFSMNYHECRECKNNRSWLDQSMCQDYCINKSFVIPAWISFSQMDLQAGWIPQWALIWFNNSFMLHCRY